MKLLVCISKSPDTTSKIDFTENNTKFNEAGVQYIVNPYDEWYALVRALELKEGLGSGSVTTITVGTAEDDSVIRKALAIGADNAVRINAEAKDAYFTAFQIAEYAKSKGIEVVNTPAASSRSVAELVFAHLFGMARFLHDANRQMPGRGSAEFKDLKTQYAKGLELKGKT